MYLFDYKTTTKTLSLLYYFEVITRYRLSWIIQICIINGRCYGIKNNEFYCKK